MFILEAVGRALTIAGLMAWQILWPLGFTLSGVIQAIVRKERIVALLHDDFPHYLSIAAGRSPENLPSCQTKRPRTPAHCANLEKNLHRQTHGPAAILFSLLYSSLLIYGDNHTRTASYPLDHLYP